MLIPGTMIKKKTHRVGNHEPVRELHASALAVGHLVHAPLRVDVQDVDDPRLAFGVHVRDGVEHLPRGEVPGEGDAVAGEGDVALPVNKKPRRQSNCLCKD